MGIIKEFKEFAIKGNMIDMAVGIIIGTAFNKIVDVLVKQIVLPPLSIITSGISFSDKKSYCGMGSLQQALVLMRLKK